MCESGRTSSFRRLQRLSQSAVELSLIDFDENAGSISGSAAALPSDKAANMHVLGELSSTLSPSVGAASMMSTEQSPANARKPSPIRAFLTPPLMRKRKPNSTKHLNNEEAGNSNTAKLFGSSVLSTGSHRKSFGFLGLLKAKFADRTGRTKQPVSATQSVSTIAQETGETYSRGEEVSDPSVEAPLPSSCVEQSTAFPSVGQEHDQCDQRPDATGREEPADNNPQLWASAGLSVAAATAASSLMPMKLTMGKKTSVVSMPGAPLVPPATSLQQPGSIQPTGPFRLHVVLKQGRDLAAKDSCGTSDPYVKFKLGSKIVHRTKTVYKDLNPIWDEEFDTTVDDLTTPLHIRVYDYDLIGQDDFLGSCNLDLTLLELHKVSFYSLDLFSDEADGRQGIIDLTAGLYPKLPEDDSDHKSTKMSEQAKKMKVQIWSSIVNILVIEGKHLANKDGDPLNKPYLRLKLSNEKYKTKSVSRNSCSTSVTWLEQFDFHLFEDQSHILEIHLYEKSSLGWEESVARAVLDLASVEGERTHSINCDFQNGGSGTLSLLVTISGTTASETISDLSTQQQPETQSKEEELIKKRYSLWRTLHNVRDVGHLSVKVFRATGLASADIGGKSDPFCVLQLVNARLQTQTEYKTLNPSWNKIFTFNVKDINSVLQVTVYDEDRDHRFEFLGTVYIPLLRIVNGQKRWYGLKEKKLRSRAKGNSPQILLELSVNWNMLRATIQTLQPKEKKYIEPDLKFSRTKFVRNVMRVKNIALDMVESGKFIESCFEWESKIRSSACFAVFLIVTWNFELYLVPLALLFAFLKSLIVRAFSSHANVNEYDSDHASNDDDDDDGDDKKGESKTFKERLQVIQEATLTVQNSIGFLASIVESIKNTFNFSVPFLSYMAIILLLIGSIVLYAVPLRYLILAWGINKFTRKLLRPHSIPNNEAIDFLSRVPDDEQLIDYREFRLDRQQPTDSHSDTKSSRKTPKKK